MPPGPGKRRLLKQLSKSEVDFAILWGCDPGRLVFDECSCTAGLLRSLDTDVVFLQDACVDAAQYVRKMSGGQVRPWTEYRGDFRSTLLKTSAAQVGDLHTNTILGHAQEYDVLLTVHEPLEPTAAEHDASVFRLFYLPCIWAGCVVTHLVMLASWFHGSCRVQCTSRCTVAPAWAAYCWATFCRAEGEPSLELCATSCVAKLSLHWPAVERVFMHYIYPCLHLAQAVGEVALEDDIGGAAVSVLLALLWILIDSVFDMALPVVYWWRSSVSALDVDRTFQAWKVLFVVSVCNSIYSFRLLLGGSDADLRMVDAQFYAFMFAFGLGVHFTVVHRCDLSQLLQSPAICAWQLVLLLTVVWIISHGAFKDGMATAPNAFNFGLLVFHALLMMLAALTFFLLKVDHKCPELL